MTTYPPLSSLSITDVIEDIPEMVFIYRDDGLLVAMNERAEQTIGVARAAMVDQFNIFTSARVTNFAVRSAYSAAFAGTPQRVPISEVKVADREQPERNGASAWVQTMILPLARRADGSAPYAMGLVRDVTELVLARREIESAQRQIGAQQDTIASLEAAKQEIEAQRATIEALSTPVIEVWDGIVTLPLLGHFDAARTARLTSQVLAAVAERRARHVILDLTGVAVFGEEFADHLLRVLAAVSLLGAAGILVGIRAEVAPLLLGADLRDVRVHQNLRDALRACMGAGAQ